jgi:hypothetical protein
MVIAHLRTCVFVLAALGFLAPSPNVVAADVRSKQTCAVGQNVTHDQRVDAILADGSCADEFIKLLVARPRAHLPAFYALISSRATERVFFAVYDAMSQGTFRFNAAVVNDLYVELPAVINQCTEPRCGDWFAFVARPLLYGALFRCPDLATLDRDHLLAVVPHGDYSCINALVPHLAAKADDIVVDRLLRRSVNADRPWARRNALRVIGHFAAGATAQTRTLLTVTHRSEVLDTLHPRLRRETDEDPLHDIVWILDSFFYPDFAMERNLEMLTEATNRSSALRFRAIGALTRLYRAKERLNNADVAFLNRNIAGDDRYVRAQIAFFLSITDARVFPAGGLDLILDTIERIDPTEPTLVARVYYARALDAHRGGGRLEALRIAYEASHLGNVLVRGPATIRSGLAPEELARLADILDAERGAFTELLGGAPFDTPVPNDPNPTMTLVVFATNADYREYMESFIGFGRDAGGLYLERIATLYTYQRTPEESRFTLEELVQHEYGHYLQGRFVYPGMWGEPGDFIEPKGWADEGFSEVLAGLTFPPGQGGRYTLPPRTAHLATLCGTAPSLDRLFARREGYDQSGVFDYAGAWAYVYYLVTSRPSGAKTTYEAFRDRSYVRANVAAYAGFGNVPELETAYHGALNDWCTASSASIAARSAKSRARTVVPPLNDSVHVPRLPSALDRPEPPALRSTIHQIR